MWWHWVAVGGDVVGAPMGSWGVGGDGGQLVAPGGTDGDLGVPMGS